MASSPGLPLSPSQLSIVSLNDVLVLLRKCQFPDKRWFELGLALGLSKRTLDTIKANNPLDVNQCLIECLSKWLERADDVVNKGGATCDSLSTAIRAMNEIAIAENLEKERCPEVLAVNILNKHFTTLSKSLSDPVHVARLLYGEQVISQQKLNDVEDDNLSLSDKRQILLSAVKDAVQANHVSLQKFFVVLCHLTRNVKLGESILRDYRIYFSSDEEFVFIRVDDDDDLSTEGSDTVSPTCTLPKTIEVAICRSMRNEFTTLRKSYAKMSYSVCKAIRDAKIELEELKVFLGSVSNKLKENFKECKDVSSALRVVDNECSLVDIELFCAVVENFEIKAADKHIKKYSETSTEYFKSNPISCYVKEKLKASETYPLLQCEKVTFVLDWRPEDTKLDDIKDILSKISGKLVKIEIIDNCESVSVTCSFPYHLTGVLITQLKENLEFLKTNNLKKLTIGYWIMWEREEEKEDKEIEILEHGGSSDSKKEMEAMQKKMRLLSNQLLDKETETERLEKIIILLKSKIQERDQQLEALQQQVNEREKQTREREHELEKLLREKKIELEQQNQEKEEQTQQIKQARGREHVLEQLLRQKETELEQQDEEKEKQTQQIKQAREREHELEQMLREKKTELDQQDQEKEKQIQQIIKQAREREHELEQMLRGKNVELDRLGQEKERQLQQCIEKEMQAREDLQQKLKKTKQQLEERQKEFQEKDDSWVVNRGDIIMTEVVLGTGSWAEVRLALFYGLQVAAKFLHELIIAPYTIGVFSRQMNIASKIRHPNLLQFIGATTEGNPIILTELMPTSLRKEIETGGLAYHTKQSIILDVACALNYLHLFEPHPILHRGISSANVLLQPMGGGVWRAKVSIGVTVSFQHLRSSTDPTGNPVYLAPEALKQEEHSPAMDVFSYGVLLIEMVVSEFPVKEKRGSHIDTIKSPALKSLIERCLMEDYRQRPTMKDIIKEIHESISLVE
ncbi:PREDICTED: putative leucine-rich repeat-containing protein DDB_G0290503 isoform X1 [Amphimedon queenslandica]|uniref:Protein kinase domain-containing protein n=1 Tax=Amphimedon queenslandica TaxID=400682 RepID=A0AAN0JIS6_AMPQE|nr:PREDICTED: putative leucine-rich repeat-containing protein DDB_G0290503 isoform X1 [Amphimedon queenslandica]|eukprot:XP_019856701.1 PREDICTED: putative leucine-rich repeat-containing protein DDB_G0290503 isoform X1 [Amphimedon queenslandica]